MDKGNDRYSFFVEKYSDFAILMVEEVNAKRRFSMSLGSYGDFAKMLHQECVDFMVMSDWTLLKLMMKLDSRYAVPDFYGKTFMFMGVRAMIQNDMDNGRVFMLDSHDDAISMEIIDDAG